MTQVSGSEEPGVRSSRLRPTWLSMVANGVGLVAVLAAAWFVAHSTPGEEKWQSAIPVNGAVGETISGRNLEATVNSVRVAEEVTASNGWAGPTSGVWVVVDASVAKIVDDRLGSLGTANLVINTTTYSASKRPDLGSISGTVLSTGIPLTGPLMFEVPRALVESEQARTAEIQFAVRDDTRADSLLIIEVDLTELTIVQSLETDEPVRGMQ